MARHKVPQYIEFVDSFPMNAAGKILKYKMREEAMVVFGECGFPKQHRLQPLPFATPWLYSQALAGSNIHVPNEASQSLCHYFALPL